MHCFQKPRASIPCHRSTWGSRYGGHWGKSEKTSKVAKRVGWVAAGGGPLMSWVFVGRKKMQKSTE